MIVIIIKKVGEKITLVKHFRLIALISFETLQQFKKPLTSCCLGLEKNGGALEVLERQCSKFEDQSDCKASLLISNTIC